ncbi:MAG: hypothetical protein OXC57_07425 [Rhodobacteraceae bacterium]|nr:hypothetical protein [Paracoccaceae bacterium]
MLETNFSMIELSNSSLPYRASLKQPYPFSERENADNWRKFFTNSDIWGSFENRDSRLTPLHFSTIYPSTPSHDYLLDRRIDTHLKKDSDLFFFRYYEGFRNFIQQNKIQSEIEFRNRINELKHFAEEDEIQINKASEDNFWKFLNDSDFNIKMDALYLNDNGNYRAVWDDDLGNLLGIEFYETNKVHFMILSHSKDKGTVSIAGEVNRNNIIELINLYDLKEICAF